MGFCVDGEEGEDKQDRPDYGRCSMLGDRLKPDRLDFKEVVFLGSLIYYV